MYYELEIYENPVPAAALDDNPGGWAIVNAFNHAKKAIFGEKKAEYSIMLGKEIITSVEVVNASEVGHPASYIKPALRNTHPGLSITVRGHLYEPYRDYDNAALLAIWFQNQENYNMTQEVQEAHLAQIKADIETIDPKGKGLRSKRLSMAALKLEASAAHNFLDHVVDAFDNEDVADEVAAAAVAADTALAAAKTRRFRKVVLRVLNDDGFVFRIYYLPEAYLANYVESYDMEKDTGEFSMSIIQDKAAGEKAKIKGKDLDDSWLRGLTKLSRNAAKAKTYVEGAAAATKNVAAVAGTVAAFGLMATKGKDTQFNQIMKKVTAGIDRSGDIAAHSGDVLGAAGGMGKGGSAQDGLKQVSKANEELAKDERNLAVEASHPKILEEEERDKLEKEAEEKADQKYRVAELEKTENGQNPEKEKIEEEKEIEKEKQDAAKKAADALEEDERKEKIKKKTGGAQ